LIRKTHLWHLLIALLLLSISCGPGERSTTEITFAAALLPSEQTEYTAILEEFTRQTGIRVHLIPQQYAQIRTTIEAEAQAGQGHLDLAELDVYLLPVIWPLMLPLDTLIAHRQELARQVPKDAWEVCFFGDPERLLYLPHRLNWQAMIYDARTLKEPPSNWQELREVAERHSGAIGLKAARYEGLVCDLFPFLWQAGGSPLQPDSPAARETMALMQDLSPHLNSAVRSYKENTILQALEHQEIVLHFNWPFAVPLLRQKNLLPQRFRTAPLPRGPGGRSTILGGGYLGIPATAPHPEAAARLLDYLTSPQVQKEMVASMGWFPMRPEGWEAMTEQDREHFVGFLAMRQEVRARPNRVDYQDISRIWQDGFHEMIFEDADPAATLSEMQKRIDELDDGIRP
jgi:ABC-type glycerol-3-phosphate transport system substrate-binding protein